MFPERYQHGRFHRGIVLIGAAERDAFDDVEVSLAHVVASHATAVLDRIREEEKLRQQNERLDEFVGMVTHDVRNPLNVARGRIDLAMADGETDHLVCAAEAVDRSLELIEGLHDLARHGGRIGDCAPVALADTARRCWGNVETSGAELDVAAEGTILADESRLAQLFENLFRNAIEHGSEGAVVTVGDLEDGFFVEDDGPGIPPDDRDRVFETGYSTREGGTGFGLSIVERIVDGHGWDVRVVEGASGGARFEVTGVDVPG